MTFRFLLPYALRALYRGGQRTLLAGVCIAFGVLSLVALQLLATTFERTLIVSPRQKLGGDAAVALERPLEAADLARLDTLRRQGWLAAYTPLAVGQAPYLRAEGSGRVYLVSRVYGVDPAVYPLVGAVVLEAPQGASPADVLGPPEAAVVSRDLARRMELGLGDAFSLAGGPGAPPLALRVAGIARDTPDHFGGTVYYGLATARRLAGSEAVAAQALVTWGPRGDAGARLEQAGFTVRRPSPSRTDQQTADLFAFAFGGAGLLGLLVGGIGVANTLQVILARRTQEIATLKALGYRARDLLLLFGIETALLGTAGAVVGAAGAVGLAGHLTQRLGQTLAFLLEPAVDPWVVAGGVGAGVLTAVVFGLAAIVRAAGVRPASLFRSLPERRPARAYLATGALYGLLLLLFAILGGVLLGSWAKGLGVVGVGVAGLALLGGLHVALLLGLVRLPLPGLPLFNIARRNLRHRPLRAGFALTALFVGVFSIGFAAAALLSAQQRAEGRRVATDGVNLTAYAAQADAAALRKGLDVEAVTAVRTAYPLPAVLSRPAGARLSFPMEAQPLADMQAALTLTQGGWPAGPGEVLLPAYALRDSLHVGDTLVAGEATVQALRVAGFYEPQRRDLMEAPAGLALLPEAAASSFAPPTVVFRAAVDPARLAEVAGAVGAAVPAAFILTKADLDDFLNRIFQGLFGFVVAVAGLALVAGAVLIANAVALSLLERRRELGVFKAIGYSSRQVMGTVLMENALLGLLSGATGLLAVQAAIALVNTRFDGARLALGPAAAALLLATAVVLAVGSAALVAWRPLQRRPLAVLRDE